MKTKRTARKTKLSKQQLLKVQEGRQILEEAHQSFLLDRNGVRLIVLPSLPDMPQLALVSFTIHRSYSVPDLAKFADQHQKALDSDPTLNGVTAALHVLDKYYKD